MSQEDAVAGDKQKLADLTRMSALDRDLNDNGIAMVQLLQSCQVTVECRLGQCRAQGSLHQVYGGAMTFHAGPNAHALGNHMLCPAAKTGALTVMQEEMQEGKRLVAGWDGELQELRGQAELTEGCGAELEVQESIAAKEEEVSVAHMIACMVSAGNAGRKMRWLEATRICPDMQVRMLEAKLSAARGLAQQKEAAAQLLSLPRPSMRSQRTLLRSSAPWRPPWSPAQKL